MTVIAVPPPHSDNLARRWLRTGRDHACSDAPSRCKIECVVEWGISVDTNFLKAHAERCRSVAENADEFTKRRLLDLAANYDRRVKAAGPTAATRIISAPLHLTETPKQI
jgi:hypothetical protein